MATLSVYNFKNVVLFERRCFLKNDYCFMFYAMHKFEYSGVYMERTWTFCVRRTQIQHWGFRVSDSGPMSHFSGMPLKTLQ